MITESWLRISLINNGFARLLLENVELCGDIVTITVSEDVLTQNDVLTKTSDLLDTKR